MPPRVGVLVIEPTAAGRAEALAAELELPLTLADAEGFDLTLAVGSNTLELRETGGGPTGPLRVDFGLGSAAAWRRSSASPRQSLARAVGLKTGRPSVVDATAGLGRDAWVLAGLGCSVIAIERSPVLGVMLREALAKAAEAEFSRRVCERIELVLGDAVAVLGELPAERVPDVVYLDPMFPPKKKSAMPKKELRVLRRLVGHDPDAQALFEAACRIARTRVVVKRTPHAPSLGTTPDLTYSGKIARYDVYLTGT